MSADPPARNSGFTIAIFGVLCFAAGALSGAYLMFAAIESSMPMAAEAVSRGMAVEQARQGTDVPDAPATTPPEPQP